MKTTKTNLSKLIEWSSSKYNSMKKGAVLAEIIFHVEHGEDGYWEYTSGCYSERAHTHGKVKWSGGSYSLEIKQGVAIFRNCTRDVVPVAVDEVVLEKPATNQYYIPAPLIYYEIEKYGVHPGYYRVVGQDVANFHIMYQGVERYVDKKYCRHNVDK